MNDRRRVLVIYTGGTIGMIQNLESGALAPVDFDHLEKHLPELNLIAAELQTVTFAEPLDSSNMDLKHWCTLADIIETHYHDFDGFVVLHGSDTMAYSASMLSFMLENLSKPIVFTGSQLPIGMVRTDGKENLITAIEIASLYENGVPVVPEVCIYFEYQLYRGNRTFKYNSAHFDAFRSPNFPILAQAGVHLQFNRDLIREAGSGKLDVHSKLSNNIGVLTLYPGVSLKTVETALSFEHLEALVLRTYGSGNAMTAPWFIEALSEATDRGLLLINSTQCHAGAVIQGKYATSAALAELGVISAGDMTLESVLTKGMYLLGKGLAGSEFKRLFEKDLRGERTENGRPKLRGIE